MPPKFVREEEQVKRFQKMGDKIRRKAYRLADMIMKRFRVTETVIMLLVLIVLVIIFRPLIIKYARFLLFR